MNDDRGWSLLLYRRPCSVGGPAAKRAAGIPAGRTCHAKGRAPGSPVADLGPGGGIPVGPGGAHAGQDWHAACWPCSCLWYGAFQARRSRPSVGIRRSARHPMLAGAQLSNAVHG
jgi:hypothetical protein